MESTADAVDARGPAPVDAPESSPVDTKRQSAVERARLVGYVLDDAIKVPGTNIRFGLDPVLGILPVSGDAVAAIGSLYIVSLGIRLGLPPRTIASMLAFVAFDFVVGSIPLVGPLFDARIKANKRNAEKIAAHVDGIEP